MKGSDREFSYSDSEWMKIKNIVKFGTNRDADEVRVPRSYILHSPPLPVSLKSALELSALTIFAFKDTLAHLAKQRAKSAMVVIPLFDLKSRNEQLSRHKKLLTTARSKVLNFRNHILDSKELFWGAGPQLRNQVDVALSSFDKHIACQLQELSAIMQPRRPSDNASKPHIDFYFEELSNVWHEIGGLTRGKKLFIEACAAPFLEEKSVSPKAIGNRLERIKKRLPQTPA